MGYATANFQDSTPRSCLRNNRSSVLFHERRVPLGATDVAPPMRRTF
jgi:hypothetical protein